MNVLLWLGYFIVALTCGIFFHLKDDWIHVVELNFFYGDRVMRYFMIFWAFVTLLLVLICSPYTWLIDKYDSERQYLPMYNKEKKCN